MKLYIKASRTGEQFIDYLNSKGEDGIEQLLLDVNMKLLVKKISEKYEYIENYQIDNKSNPDDYYEMLGVGDFVISNFGWFVRKLATDRKDVLSSDREVAALGYALEEFI